MPSSPLDLLLLGARVHPLGALPAAEALLLRGGRVAAVGGEDEVRAAARPGARTLRLPPGACVTPGLVDAHVHPTLWALARRRAELGDAATPEEAARRVADAAADLPEGAWARGGGWSRHRWGGLPDRAAIDALLPDRPAFLESADLHAAWLNGAALERCGIVAGVPDPEGGVIVRDAAGEPTGVLLEKAVALAAAHLPVPDAAELRAALLDAQRALHAWGVTGMHSVETTGWADLGRLHGAGELTLRVLQSVPLPWLGDAVAEGWRSGEGDGRLRRGGVKIFLDGTLGSRTALMREPFEGTADRGIETLPEEEFRDAVRRAAAAGIAATVHAIGDAAVERAIDVLSSVPPPAAMPHRIEHVQLCPPDLRERLARSAITASMQPVHVRTDVRAADRWWGARAADAYAFAPLLRSGVRLAFGSDAPVETPDPRQGWFAAVRRVAWDGTPAEGWHGGNALTPEEALRAYTEGPAAAEGLEGRRGRLLPGFDADLSVWDRDPLSVPPDELLEMRCLRTMVAGEWVWEG